MAVKLLFYKGIESSFLRDREAMFYDRNEAISHMEAKPCCVGKLKPPAIGVGRLNFIRNLNPFIIGGEALCYNRAEATSQSEGKPCGTGQLNSFAIGGENLES